MHVICEREGADDVYVEIPEGVTLGEARGLLAAAAGAGGSGSGVVLRVCGGHDGDAVDEAHDDLAVDADLGWVDGVRVEVVLPTPAVVALRLCGMGYSIAPDASPTAVHTAAGAAAATCDWPALHLLVTAFPTSAAPANTTRRSDRAHPVDGFERLLLCFAAHKGRRELAGDDGNGDWAIEDRLAGVRILLEGGVDVDAAAEDGRTALHIAAHAGSLPLCEALLARGASLVAKTDEKNTPLHYAAWGGHLHVVLLLLDKGAPVNKRNRNHKTALFYAVTYGFEAIVAALLARGARVDVRDVFGDTVFALAKEGGYKEVLRMLKAAQQQADARP